MLNTVLEVSLLITPLIILLLSLATRFGAGYSASARKYLWLILAIRLLIPIGFTGQRLVTVDLPSKPVAATAIGGYTPRFADTENQNITTISPPKQPQPAKLAPTYTWRHGIYVIWLAGAAGFLFYHLIVYIGFRRRLLRWSVRVSDKKALALFEDLRREYGINKDIQLLHSPCKTPLLFGFFKPTVVLPKSSLCGEQLDTILRHELMHYTHRDLWYKMFMLIAVAAHWFNPFVRCSGTAG